MSKPDPVGAGPRWSRPRWSRYVERNALRANLVERAQDWRWCSLWRREAGCPQERGILSEWPVPRPADWLEWVNAPAGAAEEEKLRQSLKRGRPFGDDRWQREAATRLGLEKTFRERGRPKKTPAPAAAPAPPRLSPPGIETYPEWHSD